MTFGQNLSITMLQTATAFSAVVNGGTYRTPSIIKGTMENGELVPQIRTDTIEDKILSANGIDRLGYAIGGKSGTAQVIKDGSYDNTMSELVGSYIGFIGPEGELPKYVIMVKMWGEGQDIDSGEAMKLFDSLSNYLIDYLKIKPKG